MKWQNRVVYHSINPGGPNGFDTQAVEWLQIEPLGCSSPRAAALSQQYILCWFFACQLIASLFLLSILAQHMGFSLVVGLSPSFLHKPYKQEKKAVSGNYTVACPKIAIVPWRGVFSMQISTVKLSTCNSNLFLVNTNFLHKARTLSFDSFCEVLLWLFSKTLVSG